MKKTGTGNRFDNTEKVRRWMDNHKCWECRTNGADCLHHIICKSVQKHFKEGEHNSSTLNSAPLHNYPCHIGKESHLYKDETISKLLWQTLNYFLKEGIEFNDRDRAFMRVYAHLYDDHAQINQFIEI